MSPPSPDSPSEPSASDPLVNKESFVDRESWVDLERPHTTGRIARLTLKELRETLRDRRTLLTLVLMPFLLYPLLSLILRKFMITGMIAGTIPIYNVAFLSEADATLVWNEVELGRAELVRQQPGVQLPRTELFTSTDLEKSLRDGHVDVGIRVTKRPPAGIQPDDSWEMDCELLILDGSPSGEMAARYVEDCVRISGTHYVGERMRLAGVRQRAPPTRPVLTKLPNPSKSTVVSLGALIPFVLILMTITGAVYPAIDLTAGERERGTLELLVATPVPRLGLLFAKYIAVLTVAMLTGTVNLVAMTATVMFSGLGPLLWGEGGLTIGTVAAVFSLLFLLASFFAALLLAITSFARSFKEAQAYLIPLMLCALGPGVISLMPGVRLNAWLVVMPLLNVALLSRDVLQGDASLFMGVVVVASTCLYAFAALAIAARLFATDAVLSDARIGWAELLSRTPRGPSAGIAAVMFCLALMFPLSFAANGAISVLANWPMWGKLAAMIVATGLVYGAVPLTFILVRRVPWDTGLQWRWASPVSWLGGAMLGLSLWPFAHELTLATQALHLVSLDQEQLDRAKTVVATLRSVPPWLVVLAIAISPAVFEEFCFRGFVWSALRSRLRAWSAILVSAVLFGVFHLVASDALAVERLVPSTMLGIILGWVCYRTRSIFPGMALHACHNGLLTLMLLYQPWLEARGWGIQEESHLPGMWLAVAAVTAGVGALMLFFSASPVRTLPETKLAAGEP